MYTLNASMLAQGVATVCTTHGHHNPSAVPINLSTEAGSIGGVPTGGLRFGASHNAAAHMPCATMIDFYNGGGVDVACLGMAEVSFSGRQPYSCAVNVLFKQTGCLLAAQKYYRPVRTRFLDAKAVAAAAVAAAK